jgi:hypothetical protein
MQGMTADISGAWTGRRHNRTLKPKHHELTRGVLCQKQVCCTLFGGCPQATEQVVQGCANLAVHIEKHNLQVEVELTVVCKACSGTVHCSTRGAIYVPVRVAGTCGCVVRVQKQ